MELNQNTGDNLTMLLRNIAGRLGGWQALRTASELEQVQTALQKIFNDFARNGGVITSQQDDIIHVEVYEDGNRDKVLIEVNLQMPDDQLPLPIAELIATPNGCSVRLPNGYSNRIPRGPYISTYDQGQTNVADVHYDVTKNLIVLEDNYNRAVAGLVSRLLTPIITAIHRETLTEKDYAVQQKVLATAHKFGRTRMVP